MGPNRREIFTATWIFITKWRMVIYKLGRCWGDGKKRPGGANPSTPLWVLCLLCHGSWIKLGPMKKNKRWGKNRGCAGRWKNDKRNDVSLEALFGFTAQTEFLMYFKVVSCTPTYQDGLGWFVIAVTGALRLGLQRFVPVDPASQLMGQPVKPTCRGL